MPHADTTATRAPASNSPKAAARLVALALIANGEIKPQEWATLHELHAREELGLSEQDWHEVLRDLCEELLQCSNGAGNCLVDADTLRRWLSDIDDPELQQRVMRLSAAVVGADGHVDAGECFVLRGMLAQWELTQQEQADVEPLLYGLDFQVLPRRAAATPA